MLYKIWPLIVTVLLSSFLVFAQAQAQTSNTQDEIAIQNVIADQIDAFQSNDPERAFSHAAPLVRQIFETSERFISMVKNGYDPLYNPSSYAFSRNTEQDGKNYQEVIVTDQNGKQWRAIYTLQKQEDGSWKVTRVDIEPTQGAAT